MSSNLDGARLASAIDEAFGRKPRHSPADLRAIAEAEDAAEINGLVAEIAALAVTRLGKSEDEAVQHARWALLEARQMARGSTLQMFSVPSQLRDSIWKLRSQVSFAAESARKPVPTAQPPAKQPTREKIQHAIDEAFGRNPKDA